MEIYAEIELFDPLSVPLDILYILFKYFYMNINIYNIYKFNKYRKDIVCDRENYFGYLFYFILQITIYLCNIYIVPIYNIYK